MFISLKVTPTQTRMEVGRVTLPSSGPMRGKNVIFMAKSQVFDRFCISLLVFFGTHPQFIEMIMLISFVGTLTETIMGVGGVTFPSNGSMGAQYVFLMQNLKVFLSIISGDSVLFHQNVYSNTFGIYLSSNKKQVVWLGNFT